ncbi:MAG: hypothetical protein ABJB74_03745 [Gemmatimonas sp.]
MMVKRFAAPLVAAVVASLITGAVQAQANIKRSEATESWRVDGSEAGEPFADLRDYVVLKNGHLWALDFKDQNIRRYDPNGKFLSIVGGKGAGPGELQNANGMAVAPSGDVWVNDPRNGRISVYGADGKYLRQITRNAGGWGYRWDGWFNRSNGELVERPIGGTVPKWQRYDAKGTALGTMPYTECASAGGVRDYIRAETPKGGSMMGAYPFATGGGLAANGTDGVWCAAPNSTRVALIRAGALDSLAQTKLEIPNVVVGSDERAAEIARIEQIISKYTTNNFDKSKIPNTKPGIAALHVDEDGRLWVQHAAKFGQRSTTLDLFDGKGVHVSRVVLPVRQSTAMPIRSRGNLVWLTVLDEDDVPGIVQFRIRN